jgi:DUF917 family protein
MRSANAMVYVNVIPQNFTTGLPTINKTGSGSVYPNPNTGTFTIFSIQPGLRLMNYDLQITDVTGREVYHQTINNQSQNTINLYQCSNGIYFYQLTNDIETLRGKFVIEK